jgi:5-methylcytosine-specific restriction endonuclease McrA
MVGIEQNGSSALWLCRCDCGNTKVASANKMRVGNTKSCGCLKREREAQQLSLGPRKYKTKEEAAKRYYIRTYQYQANKRGRDWNLTDEQFFSIVSQDCHYCGEGPSEVSHRAAIGFNFLANGIDRVDNSLGYTPENVVPCCPNCNWTKRKMTVSDFLSHCRKVVEFNKPRAYRVAV